MSATDELLTKTKKQLRAEAVERLKNCVAARFDAESIVIALTSGRHGQSDWSLECDKLIDLLTDDANDDLAPENGVSDPDGGSNVAYIAPDSREKLEADIWYFIEHNGWFGYEYEAESYADCRKAIFEIFKEWLDRQAAITEREHPGLTVSDDESLINWRGRNYLPQSRVLNAERERDEFSLKLKHEMELNLNNRNAHDLERIDELTAERDNWKEHSRTIEYRCKKAETDCEIYRKKFGKCLDYADAIHALMDDEGMA